MKIIIKNKKNRAAVLPTCPHCGRRGVEVGGVALTDYAPIRLDTEGINRVWRDLHGTVHSNAACFGDDIILITSHTG